MDSDGPDGVSVHVSLENNIVVAATASVEKCGFCFDKVPDAQFAVDVARVETVMGRCHS